MLDSEDNCFVIYFDQSLYEAPQIILNLEEELEKQEKEKEGVKTKQQKAAAKEEVKQNKE